MAETLQVLIKGRLDEVGMSGLKRSGARGWIDEEFLRELTGDRATKVFREMSDNDAVVAAILYAVEMIIRNVEFRYEGEDEETKEFVESCFHDMMGGLPHLINEALSMLVYGYSYHEIVYKQRKGPNPELVLSSRFTDGKIGWARIAQRSQDSLHEWMWDEHGDVAAFVQVAPPIFNEVTIPITRSLLFRVSAQKNNPEGNSLLRKAYRAWFFKKNAEVSEAIGTERELAGLAVIYADADTAALYADNFDNILRNIRRGEQEGVRLPARFDDHGNRTVELKLLSSGGTRAIDVSKTIDRYNTMIAMTMLADFILLGHQNVGSFALNVSKSDMFLLGVGAIIDAIVSELNNVAIPRLLRINGLQIEDPPRIVPGDLQGADLKEIAAYITSLAGAGARLFPDDDLENHLRAIGDLPELSEEMLAQAKIPVPDPKKTPPDPKKEDVPETEEDIPE